MNMRIILSIALIFYSSFAFAANNRPSNETTYTLQTSDLNDYVIGTNQNAGMTWTLDTLGTYGTKPTFTVKNNSRYELVIRPTGNAIGTFAGVKAYSLALQAGQSALIWSDGTDWQHTASPAAQLAAMGNGLYVLSSSPITREWFVKVSGPCQTGDDIGFDWASTNPAFNLHFRHTMNCATANPWKDAGDDLSTQFKNYATVQSALTPDIALQASYLLETNAVSVYFNGNSTLLSTSTVTLTAYKGPGSTETIIATAGANILGNPTGIIVGRSPSTFGKPPANGDGLFCMFGIGDTLQGAAPVFANVPDYFRICANINNPNAGNLSSDLFINTTVVGRGGTLNFGTGTLFADVNQFVVGALSSNMSGQFVVHRGTNQNVGLDGGTSIGPGGTIYAVNDANNALEPLEIASSILKIQNPASGSGGQPLCIDANNQVYKGSGGHC